MTREQFLKLKIGDVFKFNKGASNVPYDWQNFKIKVTSGVHQGEYGYYCEVIELGQEYHAPSIGTSVIVREDVAIDATLIEPVYRKSHLPTRIFGDKQ